MIQNNWGSGASRPKLSAALFPVLKKNKTFHHKNFSTKAQKSWLDESSQKKLRIKGRKWSNILLAAKLLHHFTHWRNRKDEKWNKKFSSSSFTAVDALFWSLKACRILCSIASVKRLFLNKFLCVSLVVKSWWWWEEKKGEMKRKIEKFFIKFSNLVSFLFGGKKEDFRWVRVKCWNSGDGYFMNLRKLTIVMIFGFLYFLESRKGLFKF